MLREFAEHPERSLALVTKAAAVRAGQNVSGYSDDELHVSKILIGAKGRCCNKENATFKNYGGRGIQFRFPSISEGAKWVVANLGPRPSPTHSLDRIDNDGHYEPGNLRWATREEQARNKRVYFGSVYGNRMTYLRRCRPDYTYQGIVRFVQRGWTDEQIIARVKPTSGRPRVANPKHPRGALK